MAKRGVRHIPAIDGLRALAVTAVILYHLGISWIPGGFLGVDLFFVISGYVITRLLLDSIQRSGGLDLRGFFKARVRRLLPALLFMITLTTLYTGVWAPSAIRRFLTDIPFVLTGTMNWALVYRHQDYFETIGRPPLLQHTWSLAVESQFYLLWPLILLLVLKRFGKKMIPNAALGIAAISGIALFLLSVRIDASNAQRVSHVYFGTDTHSIGLFLGAALAVSWVPQNLSLKITKRAQDFVDSIGVIGLLGILACFLFINESDATLYRIAFPLAGLFGCAIITSLVHPASRFAPLLSTRPILWIGERSYAIYLWHWIIFQITRPSVDLAGATWALYALRLLIVFALADISLRWIELPVRSGAVELWFRGMKYRTKKVRMQQKLIVSSSVLIVLLATSLISAHALTTDARARAALKANLTAVEHAPTKAAPTAKASVWLTGDSVILGIRYQLSQQVPIGLVNARVGRQAAELITVIKHDKIHMLHSPVVLDLGNNNRLTKQEVLSVFEELKDQPQIVLVNTAVPRPWRDPNDALMAEIAKQYPRTSIVNWRQISTGHPEYFGPDGVHLVPDGITAYVNAIMDVLNTDLLK